jgi:hypothetical protein
VAVEGFGGRGQGIALIVSAGVVYEIIAAACSSPQTTELNASQRADTLMKWVYLGIAQAAFFVIVAAAIDREHRGSILLGGAIAAGLLYAQYHHARAAGLANGGPATEVLGGYG